MQSLILWQEMHLKKPIVLSEIFERQLMDEKDRYSTSEWLDIGPHFIV